MSTKKGRIAEDQAERYLQRHGYTTLARNVRIGPGEIDIIVCKDDIIAFVEVKAHKQRDQSIYAVHHQKQFRIYRASSGWLAKYPEYATYRCRFDLLIVLPKKSWRVFPAFEHIQDAFRP